MFYIWSFEHRGWWKAGGWGYTKTLADAGTFTAEQAVEILAMKPHHQWHGYNPGQDELIVPAALASDEKWPAFS